MIGREEKGDILECVGAADYWLEVGGHGERRHSRRQKERYRGGLYALLTVQYVSVG